MTLLSISVQLDPILGPRRSSGCDVSPFSPNCECAEALSHRSSQLDQVEAALQLKSLTMWYHINFFKSPWVSLRMLHSSGRSRFVLHEGATLLDLREKVHTQIEDTSASPGRVLGAVATPTLWDPPSAAVSLEPTISGTPGTTIPADSLVFAVPTDAQPSNAGGARYSPPERVHGALRLAQKASSFMHARRPWSPGRMTCKQGHTHYPRATYWTLMIYCLMTPRARPDHPAQHMFRWLRVTLSWSVRGRGGHGSFGFTPAASSSVVDDVAPFAAPSAPCALPGTWSGQVPLQLAREVTLHRGFNGARRQAHTHIFSSGLNHWRSEAAHPGALQPHVGGKALPNCTRPRGSRLAFLILVSRVVLCTRLLLFMVSVHRPQSGRWAASPRSPAGSNPGSSTWSRQNFTVGSGHSISRERESRSATSSRPHVSFMPPEGGKRESLGFRVGGSRIWTFCSTLWCLLCRAGCALGRPS